MSIDHNSTNGSSRIRATYGWNALSPLAGNPTLPQRQECVAVICTVTVPLPVKIYTRTGDSGTTGLQTGERVSKADPRIRANGAVDEANAALGAALAADPSRRLRPIMAALQNDLFVLGSDISNADEGDRRVRVTPAMTANLESAIDDVESTLPPLTNFILPGGHLSGALLHMARAAARRAESHIAEMPGYVNPECMRYVNRLSDLLFVLARSANQDAGVPEATWTPNSPS